MLTLDRGILLHDDPTYFVFDPPSLRHTVTFVAISGSLDYHFDCGFMDGDDDRNIVNATTITLLVQDGKNLSWPKFTFWCKCYIAIKMSVPADSLQLTNFSYRQATAERHNFLFPENLQQYSYKPAGGRTKR